MIRMDESRDFEIDKKGDIFILLMKKDASFCETIEKIIYVFFSSKLKEF